MNIRKINKGRLRSGSLIFLITSIIKDKIGRHDVLLPINQNYDKVKKETRQKLYVFMKKTAKFPTTARAYTYTLAWLVMTLTLSYGDNQSRSIHLLHFWLIVKFLHPAILLIDRSYYESVEIPSEERKPHRASTVVSPPDNFVSQPCLVWKGPLPADQCLSTYQIGLQKKAWCNCVYCR